MVFVAAPVLKLCRLRVALNDLHRETISLVTKKMSSRLFRKKKMSYAQKRPSHQNRIVFSTLSSDHSKSFVCFNQFKTLRFRW
jgi:hypothetical protein